MALKDYISKLFKQKELNLISLNDMAYIPSRDDLSDDKIELLDEYKEKYIEILSQNKYLTSHDISSDDYTNEMVMNFYLFNRIIINQDEIYNLNVLSTSKKQELYFKYKLNPYKLSLYIKKMEKIYNETLLRLISLKEIKKELSLDKNRLDAINNEIDILTTHYIIFKNNLHAALMEIDSSKNMSFSDSEIFEYGEYHNIEILSSYEEIIMQYGKLFIPNKLDNINKLSIMDRLAYLERELEIYCYNNINVNELNDELQEIDNIEKTIENRDFLLQRINQITIKYELLNRYGGYELDLSPLYEIKFDILTIDIINQTDSPFKNIKDGREIKIYEDIVFNKINSYIISTDSILNNKLDIDNKNLIKHFISILKSDGKYDLYAILRDRIRLGLLLNIPDDNKMLEYFNNTLTKKGYSYGDYYETHFDTNFPGIRLDSYVPLSTLCRIQIMDEQSKGYFGYLTHFARIYEYYSKKIRNEDTDIYKIPEGIMKIDCNVFGFNSNSEQLKYIISKINGKKVIMSSTLKEITISNAFKDCRVSEIVFNDGLKHIFGGFLFICNMKSIIIPSSIELIRYINSVESLQYCISHNELEKIIFTDFENSILLNDTGIEDNTVKHNFFAGLFDILYHKFMWALKKDSSLSNMYIILRDKNNYEYYIDLKKIFLDLYGKSFKEKKEKENTVVFYEEDKHRKSFIMEIERQIDEILLQYKDKQVNCNYKK